MYDVEAIGLCQLISLHGVFPRIRGLRRLAGMANERERERERCQLEFQHVLSKKIQGPQV